MEADARRWIDELSSDVTGAAEAVRAYARFDALPVAERMRVAHACAAARGNALRRRFPSILRVHAGYKVRSDTSGQPALRAEPCVVLVVRRKIARHALPSDAHLPRRLRIDAGDAGDVFDVPTDVQPESWSGGATACTGAAVQVFDHKVPAPGTLTCRVQLRGAVTGTTALALSALHVLSPVAALGQVVPGAGNLLAPTADEPARAVGRSAPWGGGLFAAKRLSFDAQLATVTDTNWLDGAFQGLQLSAVRPYVAQRSTFDTLAATTRQMILVPRNHPLQIGRAPLVAQFAGYAGADLLIRYPVRLSGGAVTQQDVAHRELVCLQVMAGSPPPLKGDSGSAVLTWWPDGTLALLGMFIASPDPPGNIRAAFVLPAWELFDLTNWLQLPPGTVEITPSL